MIGVHISRVPEHEAKGYVIMEQNECFAWMVNTADTCMRQMRTGNCMMDKDHRGRCSTVVFYCDACGKRRRGQPDQILRDSDGVPDGQFCWFCMFQSRRDYMRGVY
jgi:hypothetical protein